MIAPENDGDTKSAQAQQSDLLEKATGLVSAYVGHNTVSAAQIPDLISTIYTTLASLNGGPGSDQQQEPAVSIRRSVTPDYLICLEDGKKMKMLKRHLHTSYGMTPDEYRKKWNLPTDYPMVAPNYAKRRSELAKQIGLGHKIKGG